MKPYWIQTAAVPVLLAIFAGLVWLSESHNSVTVDEFAHLPAGYHYWRTGDFSLFNKNPPLIKLIAAAPLLRLNPDYRSDLPVATDHGWRPWVYGTDFMLRNTTDYVRLFRAGRVMVLALGCVLALGVFLVSRRLYGDTGGILSLAAFIFSPTVIAHSGLATTDMGTALFMFLAVVGLAWYLNSPTWTRAVLAGVGLGLAQLSKFSALPLLACIGAAPLFLLWPVRSARFSATSLLLRYGQVACMFLVWLSLTALCYGGQDMFRGLASYEFRSDAMAGVQAALPNMPVPLPEPYVAGIDAVLADAQRGEFPNYLLGHWYMGKDWRYFPVVLAFKTPPALQLLSILVVLSALGALGRKLLPSPGEKTILCVTACLIPVFTLTTSAQIGGRYLLPLFPLFCVVLGRLGPAVDSWNLLKRLPVAILMCWLAADTFLAFPHFLSYSNVLARLTTLDGPALLDSNLDWGQDLPSLSQWMKSHGVQSMELAYFGHVDPEIYGVRYSLLGEGKHLAYAAISAQLFYGVGAFSYPMLFRPGVPTIPPSALLPYVGRKPLAMAGDSILIFEN